MLLCSGADPILRAVVACVLQYGPLRRREVEVDVVRASLDSHPSDEPLVLKLSNKYYCADVEVWLHDPAASVAWPSRPAEGCIAVMSAESAVDSHLRELADLAASQDVSVRLAVALKGETSVEDWRAERVEWCLDHGFEYVEVDFTDVTEGWSSRDKDGLPRIMEALEMNMWSSMARRGDEATKSHSKDGSSGIDAVLPDEPDSEVSTTPTCPAADTVPNDPGGTAAAEDLLLPPNMDDVQDDKVWGVFSKFVEEARTVRDQAQSGQMNDEDRRNRAAAMATRFAELMLPAGELDSSDEEN